MRFGFFLMLMLGVGLVACQYKDSPEGNSISGQSYKPAEAAVYNTRLGLEYLKQGDRPRAKRKLLTALSQAPNSPSVNASMAYLLEQSGQFEKARTFYKHAIFLAPNSGGPLNNYGAFLCRQGYYNEAEQYFLKAVSDINYEQPASAYENAGLCAIMLADNSKAKHYFLKALAHDPNRRESLEQLVRLEMKANNPNKGLEHIEQHAPLCLNDARLLKLAIELAEKTGQKEIEAQYRLSLSRLTYATNTTNG